MLQELGSGCRSERGGAPGQQITGWVRRWLESFRGSMDRMVTGPGLGLCPFSCLVSEAVEVGVLGTCPWSNERPQVMAGDGVQRQHSGKESGRV